MKHLIIGIGILLLCLALCLTVTAVLDRCTGRAAELLETSLAAGRAGNWDAAGAALSEARDYWYRRRGFWGVALRHGEVDAVESLFAQLTVQARGGSEDFFVSCADLIRQIRHLCRSEYPAYYNIL